MTRGRRPLPACLWVAVLLSAGCAVPPSSDGPVSATGDEALEEGATVPLQGSGPNVDARVTVSSWNPEDRMWQVIAEDLPRPDAAIRRSPDAGVFSWRDSVHVPDWAWERGGRGARAKLRATGAGAAPPRTAGGRCALSVGVGDTSRGGGCVDRGEEFFAHSRDYVAPYTGRGRLCRQADADCTARCVHDVEEQFAALGSLPGSEDGRPAPTGQAAFRYPAHQQLSGHPGPFPTLETDEDHGHVQGFSRIRDLSGGSWFVFSRNNKDGPAGLVFARLGERDGGHDGGPALDGSSVAASPEDQSVHHFVEIPGTKHPGGLQVMEGLVVVPSWCNDHDICEDAMISFYEVEECDSASGICVELLNRFERGDGGFPWLAGVDGDKVNFVGAARMSDGHYLLVLNRNNVGATTIMVSRETRIDEDTQWRMLETDWYLDGYDNGGDTYQNFNFVRECGTGRLYAVGLSQNGWKNHNQVDLFRAKVEDGARFDIDRIEQIFLSNPGRQGGRRSGSCEMKGGSGVYVTPSGRLVIYCSQGKHLDDDAEDRLLFAEFASPVLPGVPGGVVSSAGPPSRR